MTEHLIGLPTDDPDFVELCFVEMDSDPEDASDGAVVNAIIYG